MVFVIIIISVFLGTILYYFYNRYRNRTISKGEMLFSIESNKKAWIILGAVSSIFTGFIALFIILVCTVSTLRGYRADVIEWLIMLSAILFFGLGAFDNFPTKGRRILKFTDKGIIYWEMFYSWHEIKGYQWKPNSNGKTFSLKFFFSPWSLKSRIFFDYYSFDINAKQNADKILEGRVKIRS